MIFAHVFFTFTFEQIIDLINNQIELVVLKRPIFTVLLLIVNTYYI